MREIKFRFWGMFGEWDDEADAEKFEMMYGDVFAFNDEEPINDLFDFSNSETICMQYTGLKDKNGKMLYPGDIVKFYECPDEYLFFHGVAKVIDTEIGWDWEILEQENDEIDSTSFWNDDFEIIGNVFENPELLK